MAIVEFLKSIPMLLQRRSERGASLVEYALLVALIAVVCIIAIQFLGHSASTTFSGVGGSIANP